MKKIIPIVALVVFIISCNKKPEIEYTSTYKMAGEWWAQYFHNGAALTDHHKIATYNTSDPNSGKLWVEDDEIWPFKAKASIDYPNFAFSASTGDNELISSENVKFYEGKIITGGARSKSGVIVDSIFLRVEFSDDPGTIYEIRGHGRTGFLEDEYN
jgi:hypothetical protein